MLPGARFEAGPLHQRALHDVGIEFALRGIRHHLARRHEFYLAQRQYHYVEGAGARTAGGGSVGGSEIDGHRTGPIGFDRVGPRHLRVPQNLVAVGRDILAGAITSVRVALFATDPRSSPWPSKVIRPTDARYTGTEVNSFGDVNSELPLARNTKVPLRLVSE